MAVNMQQADVDSIWALSHHTPLEAIKGSLSRSYIKGAYEVGGETAALFGIFVPSLMSSYACPWFFGTELLRKYPRVFIEHSALWLHHYNKEFPYLVNLVDSRHKRSVKWLRWLGFTINDPVPLGVENIPFHLIELRNSNG